MKVRPSVFILLLSLFAFSAKAEPHRSDTQIWLQAIAIVPLDTEKKFSLYLEGQPRVGNDLSRVERFLLRPALVYNATKNLEFYLGYAWAPTFLTPTYDSEFRDEHRLWEQALYTHHWKDADITFQYRLRQEQRFIEHTGGTAHRTRILVRASKPWTCGGSSGLTAYNEYFANWNTVDKGPKRGIDRDRIFLGPYCNVGKARYEIGYLGEYSEHFRDGDRFINTALGMVTVNFAK
jgi:Protein of unknown function (DUF2490)